MYFDTHIHYFPDFLAPKAMENLIRTCSLPHYSDGTYGDTLKNIKKWNCIGAVALHIATNPHQQASVNHFAVETQKKNLLCFGSVHPDAPDALTELCRIQDMGLRGIKFHPDYQGFYVNDKKIFPIYEEIVRLGLPVAFHTGRDPYSPDDVHCTPEKLGEVADYFPEMRIIAAHMGGSYMPKESAKYLSGKKNVWFDTAVISEFLTPRSFEELTRTVGLDKVFYATDCPWSSMPRITEMIEATHLSSAEKKRIYYQNALEFFELDIPTAGGQ